INIRFERGKGIVFVCIFKILLEMKPVISPQKDTPKLGEGVYLPVDVATILKLPYYKVKYLMNTFWETYTFDEPGSKAINFFSLIEFYTYYNLREKGYKPKAIKAFHNMLSRAYNTPYPFASVNVLTPKKKT